MYTWIRRAENSFVEGLMAPPIELVTSMVISGMLASIGLLKIMPGYSDISFTWSIDVLIRLIDMSLLMASLIDIMRNVYVGMSRPGVALAHLLGEAISLSMIYPIIMRYSPVTFATLLSSMFMFAVGIIMRLCIEIHTGRII